jgi:hypothetical protein
VSPQEQEDGYKVIALSKEENKSFWTAEDKFNQLYYRLMTFQIFLAWLVFDVQLFLVQFEVDIVVYLAFQTFHLVNGNCFIWLYFHSTYTVNIFLIESMIFLSKKFRRISLRAQRLNARAKLINNQRLSKLISDYNAVHAELIDCNDFFKNYLGHNLIHFFGLAIFISFISMNFKSLPV